MRNLNKLKVGKSRVVADKKSDTKAKWMKEFYEFVVALDKKHQGKIDWDTATYFFNEHIKPQDAAKRYVKC